MNGIILTITVDQIMWCVATFIAIGTAYKTYEYFKSKSPIQKMNIRVDSHDEMLKNDKKRLDKVESDVNVIIDRFKGYEESNNVSEYLTLKSLQALLRNAQTGNNMDQLEEVSDELNDYILKK
ncbi:hypothetical protein [Anaerorhabdus sp.]|uniref:hypothetical protein n=1 Tax=Anaerorhabdus sp. TaxID=1872524 RepID=UPI002FCCB36D